MRKRASLPGFASTRKPKVQNLTDMLPARHPREKGPNQECQILHSAVVPTDPATQSNDVITIEMPI